MSLSRMINRPCSIIRRTASGAQDELGNETETTSEVATVCELQQQSGFRSESADEVSDLRWILFLLPGEEIGLGDSVRIDGEGEFEVYGEPWRVWNPSARTYSHIEAAVRRTVTATEESVGTS